MTVVKSALPTIGLPTIVLPANLLRPKGGCTCRHEWRCFVAGNVIPAASLASLRAVLRHATGPSTRTEIHPVMLRWRIHRDDRPCCDLDVRFRLSPDYLVRAFALTRPTPGDACTRCELVAILREQLYEHGRARLDYWTDEVNESRADELRSAVWAFAEVRRLWPEHGVVLDSHLGERIARWRALAGRLADRDDRHA